MEFSGHPHVLGSLSLGKEPPLLTEPSRPFGDLWPQPGLEPEIIQSIA
jgi:hypothetical protein